MKNNKQNNIYKKISTIIIAIVMVFAIMAFLSLIIQVAGGKKPSVFGYRLYYILTDSMTPELKVNDVILSETINSEKEARERIKEGDVVTFIAEYGVQRGLVITHKVVEGPHYSEERQREVIVTMGTKQGAVEDEPVPLENIQAVMVTRVPVLGGIYRFIMSGTGLLIVIIIPMVFMLGVLVFRLIDNIKKTEDKKELTREEKIAKEAVEDFKKKQLEHDIAKKAVEEYKKKNNIKD
ncbi:MAG: signal peptidase I [Bacillota bacterium]